MNTECLDYALAKQIPLGGEKITLDTDFGALTLEGDVGRKAVKALRLVINGELKRVANAQGGQR